MSSIFEGDLDGRGLSIAIAAARFNDNVVSRLIDGAVDCLGRHGVSEDDVSLVRVPGAYELPVTCDRIIRSSRVDAVIAIGALVRGDTPHFDFISSQVSLGLSEVGLRHGIPVIFGVLTCDTMEQAMARATGEANKGWEAALAAVEMATLFRRLGVSGQE